MVKPHIQGGADSFLIVDDSVQDKKYSKFIELVKKQYSGNVHGTICGIGVVNRVHANGAERDFYPIDFRIYAPDNGKKAKNDHFREMFIRLVIPPHLIGCKIALYAYFSFIFETMAGLCPQK